MLKKLIICATLSLISLQTFSSEEKAMELGHQKLKELSQNLNQINNEIDKNTKYLQFIQEASEKIYGECIYNLITNYDSEFKDTSFGAILLSSLISGLNNENISIDESFENIKKIEEICKKPNKYKISYSKKYVPYTFTANKESEKSITDESNFEFSAFEHSLINNQRKFDEIHSAFHSNDESMDLVFKMINMYHRKPYICQFSASYGDLKATMVGGSIGREKCTDIFGGKYKWGLVFSGCYFNGVSISASFFNSYTYQMTKDPSASHKSSERQGFCNLLLMGDTETKDGVEGSYPAIGIGGADDIKFSINRCSKKKFTRASLTRFNLDKEFSKSLSNDDYNDWANFRHFLSSPKIYTRINQKLKIFNLEKNLLENRIESIKEKTQVKPKKTKKSKKDKK